MTTPTDSMMACLSNDLAYCLTGETLLIMHSSWWCWFVALQPESRLLQWLVRKVCVCVWWPVSPVSTHGPLGPNTHLNGLFLCPQSWLHPHTQTYTRLWEDRAFPILAFTTAAPCACLIYHTITDTAELSSVASDIIREAVAPRLPLSSARWLFNPFSCSCKKRKRKNTKNKQNESQIRAVSRQACGRTSSEFPRSLIASILDGAPIAVLLDKKQEQIRKRGGLLSLTDFVPWLSSTVEIELGRIYLFFWCPTHASRRPLPAEKPRARVGGGERIGSE